MSGVSTAADLAAAEGVLRAYDQRRARLDAERDRAIGALYRAGWTDRAIADLVGCNHVTLYRWRTEAGVASRPIGARLKLPPETIATIRALAARGQSQHAIAGLLGIHRSTVALYVPKDHAAKASAPAEVAPAPTTVPEATQHRILDLARRGLNDTAIGREARVGPDVVTRLREAAGIPRGRMKKLALVGAAPVIRFEDDPRAVRREGRLRLPAPAVGWAAASSIAGLG